MGHHIGHRPAVAGAGLVKGLERKAVKVLTQPLSDLPYITYWRLPRRYGGVSNTPLHPQDSVAVVPRRPVLLPAC